MARLVLRKQTLPGFGPALMPGDEAAYDDLARVPDRTWVRADVRQPRSIQHHRFIWLMVSRAHALLDERQTEACPKPENLMNLIKIRGGWREEEIDPWTGEIVSLRPLSIAFDSMDQIEFRPFAEYAKRFIAENILSAVDVPGNNGAPELLDLKRMVYGEDYTMPGEEAAAA